MSTDGGPSLVLMAAPPAVDRPAAGRRLRGAAATGARILVVVVAALAAAVAVAVFLAAFVPGFERHGRFALGFLVLLPLWVTGMCFGFLARRPARAGLAFLLIALIAAGAVRLFR